MMMKFWNRHLVELLRPQPGDQAQRAQQRHAQQAKATIHHSRFGNGCSGANHTVTSSTPAPTTRPRTIEAPT